MARLNQPWSSLTVDRGQHRLLAIAVALNGYEEIFLCGGLSAPVDPQ